MMKKFLWAAVVTAVISGAGWVQAAIPSAEKLLPQDTIAFLTIPDWNGLLEASKVSPQLMLWNDAAMKPFHDKIMDKVKEKFISPLERDLGLKLEDYADLPQGQFTVAINLNGSNGHDDIPPGIVLLMDVKTKSDQLKTNLTNLTKKITDSGRTVRSVQVHSLPFSVVTLSTNDLVNIMGPRKNVSELGKEPKVEQPVDIYFGQYQSLLIAATSEKLVDAIASHLTGGSAPALADDAVFAADQATQFRNSPTYYGWFNARLVFTQMAALPEDDGSEPATIMPKTFVATRK